MNIDCCKLFLNYLDVLEINGYYKAERLSKKQKEGFKNQRELLSVQTEYSSGIVVEFFSNTTSVQFDYKTGFCKEAFAYFDILIDDEYFESISCSNYNYFKYKFEVNFNNRDKKKISIYFPHSSSIMINNFKIDDNSSFRYSESRKNPIVFLGDSITQGYASLHPINTYPALLSKKLNMNFINQGVAGAFHDFNTLDETLSIKPSAVISAYGTNDWSFIDSINNLKSNIEKYFNKLHKQYSSIPIFIITPIWRGDYLKTNDLGTIFDVISILIKEANKYDNFTIIDGFELTFHDATNFDDMVLHPNEDCFKVYAENLYQNIKDKIIKI